MIDQIRNEHVNVNMCMSSLRDTLSSHLGMITDQW